MSLLDLVLILLVVILYMLHPLGFPILLVTLIVLIIERIIRGERIP